MTYTNHSGGAIGADTEWENEGIKYGVKTIAYSFAGHSCKSKTPCILTDDQLAEGFEHVKNASISLKRPLDYITRRLYTKSLLSRNWFQVKNAECVFAIGKFVKNSSMKLVDGGTGWAVQMAIDVGKPVYLFEQNEGVWSDYIYSTGAFFLSYPRSPTLTKNFAGIGTREINDAGKAAIKDIYKNTFQP